MVEVPISYPALGSQGLTGTWRLKKPVVHMDKCIKCRLCWLYCPESVLDIIEDHAKFDIKIDYDYCKGCGICASQCPTKAIEMVSEL